MNNKKNLKEKNTKNISKNNFKNNSKNSKNNSNKRCNNRSKITPKNNSKIIKGGAVGVDIFTSSIELITSMTNLGASFATEVKSLLELPGQFKNAASDVPGQPNVTDQPDAPQTAPTPDTGNVLDGPVPPPQSA
tara:strand:+ start:309 stop:710 length:402 start_codon:yes stop_codon:yes gene_type:complete